MKFYAFMKRFSFGLALACGTLAIWYTFNRNYISAIYYVMLTAVNHFTYNCYKKEQNERKNQDNRGD